MANEVYSVSITDTSVHSTNVTANDPPVVFHYVNTHDQSVDVTVKGTYDGDTAGDYGVTLNTQTVASGGGVGYDSLGLDEWDRVIFEVTASTAPTSGTFTVREMSTE